MVAAKSLRWPRSIFLKLIISSLFFASSSCEKRTFLDYVVVNKSTESIVISQLNVSSGDSLIPTPAQVDSGKQITIYVNQGIGNTDRFVNGDTIHGISKLEIFRYTDSTSVKKNLRLTKYWTYNQKGKKGNGEVKLGIEDEDFD